MKKRVLSLLLATCLVLALLPAAALADDGTVVYDLWIAGTRVTSANKDNITGPGITVQEGGEVRFDPATNTLTLKNASITASKRTNSMDSSGIYRGKDTFDDSRSVQHSLTIVFSGTNLIGGAIAADHNGFQSSYGICITGDLTLRGEEDANLIISSSLETGAYQHSYGVFCRSFLTVESGNITAMGQRCRYYSTGIQTQRLYVNGGTVMAIGAGATYVDPKIATWGAGVSAYKFFVTGGKLIAEGKGTDAATYGIHTYKPEYPFIISGGQVTMISENGAVAKLPPDIEDPSAAVIKAGKTTSADDATEIYDPDQINAYRYLDISFPMYKISVTGGWVEDVDGNCVTQSRAGQKLWACCGDRRSEGLRFGGWTGLDSLDATGEDAFYMPAEDVSLAARWQIGEVIADGIKPPALGETLQTALPQGNEFYDFQQINWFVGNNTTALVPNTKAAGDTVYRVELLAVKKEAGIAFAPVGDLAVAINGDTAGTTARTLPDGRVVLSYTFPKVGMVYDIFVGGRQVTSANMNYIYPYWDEDKAENGEPQTAYAKYVPGTNTLILNDIHIVSKKLLGEDPENTVRGKSGIYALGDLNIEVHGACTVTGNAPNSGPDSHCIRGIRVGGKLTLSGDGTLTVDSVGTIFASDNTHAAIECGGLLVKSGTVNAKSEENSVAEGVAFGDSFGILLNSGAVRVEGGALNVQAGDGIQSMGIRSAGNDSIVLTGGTLTVSGHTQASNVALNTTGLPFAVALGSASVDGTEPEAYRIAYLTGYKHLLVTSQPVAVVDVSWDGNEEEGDAGTSTVTFAGSAAALGQVETLVAARLTRGILWDVALGELKGNVATFPGKDLTEGNWKLFLLKDGLAPLCAKLDASAP